MTKIEKILAVCAAAVTIMGGVLTMGVIALGGLWGYFTIQRDVSDNKAAVVEIRAANLIQTKNIEDINQNGTLYGRNKVDGRMAEIAATTARVEKLEGTIVDMSKKLDRIDDRMEQVWSDYMNRRDSPPAHIDPKQFSKN